MSEAFFHHAPLQAGHRRIRELADKLDELDAVTSKFLTDIVRDACPRLPSLRRTTRFGRLERLIQSGAWTDAVFALLELELPQWQLRCIAYDAGEWHCVLSRQRELPDWLDQPIEAHHADLSLAVLKTLLEALRMRTSPVRNSVPSVHRTDEFCVRLCCDNFA